MVTLFEHIESERFYNLMQDYRHTPFVEQDDVIARFKAVKDFICDPFNRLTADERDEVFGLLIIPPPTQGLAKKWCRLNMIRGHDRRTEDVMSRIEHAIGLKECLKEWNRERKEV